MRNSLHRRPTAATRPAGSAKASGLARAGGTAATDARRAHRPSIATHACAASWACGTVQRSIPASGRCRPGGRVGRIVCAEGRRARRCRLDAPEIRPARRTRRSSLAATPAIWNARSPMLPRPEASARDTARHREATQLRLDGMSRDIAALKDIIGEAFATLEGRLSEFGAGRRAQHRDGATDDHRLALIEAALDRLETSIARQGGARSSSAAASSSSSSGSRTQSSGRTDASSRTRDDNGDDDTDLNSGNGLCGSGRVVIAVPIEQPVPRPAAALDRGRLARRGPTRLRHRPAQCADLTMGIVNGLSIETIRVGPQARIARATSSPSRTRLRKGIRRPSGSIWP